ncbi:hypothetical protein ACH5RR_016413 [Cinchona calisaya]|uniref:Protein kinase domain-containing protein n=1 Tax=Cinchona calisaya TaxID=153742 RepID=A0ABD2ZWW3_9GENT
MAQVVASLEQALEQQESHMISAPINATVVVKEEVQILGENVIPSPEEGITRESTDNSYSPTIGNDIQSRRTGYARVPRSSWNWPWKAFWNRGMKDELRKMDIEILPEKSVQSGKDQLGVGFTAIGAKVKGERNVGRKKSLMFFGNVGRGFDLNKLLHAPTEILGHGMLGTAYMAMLETGITVAVKRLRDVSHVTASEKEFRKKMEEIGKMDHANLMPLLAYYYSRDKKLLVYDYLPMGSLSALLHGQSGFETPLNWETRATIALGAARGITFLHSQGPSVSHGNIKSSNVLLTSTYKARISDFGIAHLASPHPTPYHFSGYWAPEITHPLKISQKADVYSFGVLLLELLTGKSPTHSIMNDKEVHLPSWVRFLLREERTEEVFDVKLSRYQNIEEDMVQLLQLALNCTAQCPDGRPSMTEVTNRIEELYGSTSQDPT